MKKFFAALLGALMLASITGCGGSANDKNVSTSEVNSGKDTTIRMSWWGANTRNERMNQILDTYEKDHPGITVTREYTNWNDYWTKFTTQAATGTQPDVSPFVMQSIREYVNKGVLLPLDEYVESGKIDLSDWTETAKSPGILDGKIYGIVYALSAQGVIYNQQLIESVGGEIPPETWTMDEFVAYCKDLRAKLPDDVWVVETAATSDHAFEAYIRSIGKTVYSEDGKSLGFEKKDLASWFALWEDLRKSGCTPDAGESAEAAALPYESSYLVLGKTAMLFQNCNLMPTFNSLSDSELFITRAPSVSGNGCEILQPTAFGISSKSKVVDESVDLINYLVNDIDANLVFKADYGAPADPEAIEALNAEATKDEKKNYDFIDLLVKDSTLPETVARAEGSATIMDALKRTYENISSGAVDINAGVDDFFAEAEDVLSKNQ
ncbi:ABC transporter substrate-binding protein [Massiliimalia massiliensis]|uniref:ABC transporter substrate-binding protein n=1 Tax=Massiliimalia massiliensis TaxID=1852384 RepID=UPI0013566118|nr:extracellular solute-binding protein [Massiliimalia massiliensis]